MFFMRLYSFSKKRFGCSLAAIIKLEPTEEISSVKNWLKLAPRDALTTTAAMPITIPSVVSADLSLELPILPDAIRAA